MIGEEPELVAQSQFRKMTLNQPIKKTLMRDLTNIFVKLKYSMIPSLRKEGRSQLKQWDLWGPMLLCLLLSLSLAWRTDDEAKTVITTVVVVVWVGAVAVYLNAYFLGSPMSLGQSTSLLGYCLFPIIIANFIMLAVEHWAPPILKLALVVVAFVWSSTSSIAFIGQVISARKRKLALYPVILFYLFFSWFVLIV